MPVDLSPAALTAAAGVDPWALARQVGTGDAGGLEAGGLRVRRAGLLAAEAARDGERADLSLAAAFLNDGAAVFDAAASSRRGAVSLAERGEKVEEVARAVLDVAAALAEAVSSTASRLATLGVELNRLLGQLGGVRVVGPDPVAVAAGMAAAEQRCFRVAVDLVRGAGDRIQADLDAYDALLRNRTARLDGLGYGGPPERTAVAASFGMAPEDRVGQAVGEELAANPEAAASIVAGLVGVVAGAVLLLRGRQARSLIDRSARLLGDGVAEIAAGVAERLDREARRAGVRESVLHPDGTLPGEPGKSRRVRVVEQPEMDRIEHSIRDRLGVPDRVIEKPEGGRIEIWEVGPGEAVAVRDFSRSGRLGTAGDRTIDVDINGLENVEKIHVQP
jgi:hypothetical protein